MENRERITGIVIHVVGSDGQGRTVTIDPTRTEALFWSDRAVNEILAPFYDTIDKTTTKTELIKRFGSPIEDVFSELAIESEEVRITPTLVKGMWQLTHRSRKDKLSFIQKTVNCIPRPCNSD